MYRFEEECGKNTIIIADTLGIYAQKACTVLGQATGRLTFWCNCLGEINIPGKPQLYCGKVEELPPVVQTIYEQYQQDADGMSLYTVTLNDTPGMLFTMVICNDWVEENVDGNSLRAYRALKAATRNLRDSGQLPEEVQLLVLKDTDPDGHELGVFFPASVCDKVPEFQKASWDFYEKVLTDMVALSEKDKAAMPYIVELNTLANACGHFYNAECTDGICANNGYNCLHQAQEEVVEDEASGKYVGCCYAWSCPLAYPPTLADLADYNVIDDDSVDPEKEESSSDFVVVTDPNMINKMHAARIRNLAD